MTRAKPGRERAADPAEPEQAKDLDNGASTTRRDLVAEAILEQAAEIFASRGVQGTGIREIAEALNMSRPAVYHYFSSKEAILEQLLSGYTGALTGFFREVRYDTTRTPAAKLREMITGLAIRVADKPAYLRLLANNEQDLPDHLARAHARARHEAMEHMTAVIAEGIDAGDIRPVDERVVAFGLFGMCHWIAWWYRPGGPATAQQIAEEFTEMAVAGLFRPDGRRGGGGIQQAIEHLRENLAYLERLTGTSQ